MKLRLLTVIAVLQALAIIGDAAPADNGTALADDTEWTDFKIKFNKHYDNHVQENFRRSVFHDNKRKIKVHNELHEAGVFTYKIKMNQFGDMLLDEYSKYMHAENKTILTGRVFNGLEYAKSKNDSDLPSSIDWRKRGAVSPVKDQGLTCGACWAFSAVGALEGQHFQKSGILKSLSAQYLIDCSSFYGNLGCGGGSAALAFQYVVDHKTLIPEVNYTYQGVTNACPYEINGDDDDDQDDEETELSFYYIVSADDVALKEAVATVGPISAAIDGSHDAFRFYSEGIYYQAGCDSSDINHAILIVGYGTSGDGQDYWLVKNSWGEAWGEGGYFKIARNESNHCGIAAGAIYPIV